MARSIRFWSKLGFVCIFCDAATPDESSYAGIRREGVEFHLQTFTLEQRRTTQTMAVRVEMASQEDVGTLHEEWEPLGIVSAALSKKPWGTFEFGFYDPDGTPFFFYSDA